MSLVAIVATIFAILYLIWAIKNDPVCFVFGLISSVAWAWESYMNLNLTFDAGLQVFYVIMSIVGILRWKYGGENYTKKNITKLSLRNHFLIVGIGAVMTFFFISLEPFLIKKDFIGLDALTTVFTILGTFLLVDRKLYSWIYLFFCNLLYIYIYANQGSWLFVGMMIVYSVFSLVGFTSWKKILTFQLANKSVL